jgi:hypothetical protein
VEWNIADKYTKIFSDLQGLIVRRTGINVRRSGPAGAAWRGQQGFRTIWRFDKKSCTFTAGCDILLQTVPPRAGWYGGFGSS